MGPARRFHVGDRVRTIRPVLGLQLGSLGTIEEVVSFNDLYDVRFDGLTEAHYLQGRALELAMPSQLSREVGQK